MTIGSDPIRAYGHSVDGESRQVKLMTTPVPAMTSALTPICLHVTKRTSIYDGGSCCWRSYRWQE